MRLVHAERLAVSFESHLIGLYANPLPDYALAIPIEAGPASIANVIEVEQRAREDGDAAFARLTERVARLRVPSELRRIEARLDGIERLAVSQARCADLFIATSPYRANASPAWDFFIEAVLFEGGHGLYLAPPGSKPAAAIDRVLIAWRDTREAARAVARALPFLMASKQARLVVVAPARNEEAEEETKLMAAHLGRHGVNVEVRSVETAGRSVGKALLDEAHEMAADLIVMGAYGHSRFREWVLGGVTRQLIESSDLPILLAH